MWGYEETNGRWHTLKGTQNISNYKYEKILSIKGGKKTKINDTRMCMWHPLL